MFLLSYCALPFNVPSRVTFLRSLFSRCRGPALGLGAGHGRARLMRAGRLRGIDRRIVDDATHMRQDTEFRKTSLVGPTQINRWLIDSGAA